MKRRSFFGALAAVFAGPAVPRLMPATIGGVVVPVKKKPLALNPWVEIMLDGQKLRAKPFELSTSRAGMGAPWSSEAKFFLPGGSNGSTHWLQETCCAGRVVRIEVPIGRKTYSGIGRLLSVDRRDDGADIAWAGGPMTPV